MSNAVLESPERESSPMPPGPQPPARITGDAQLGPALLAAVATILTTTALTRVFEGFAWWFVPCVGAVVVAAGMGLLARLARVPLLGLPLVYLIGLALYVPQVSAPETRLGPLPTTATWSALSALLGVGAEDVRRLAVPVPERAGLVLLVVLGTFAVAAVVDAMATRLRSPATAGLPLLALLAVPAAIVPGDVGLVPFVAAAVGYLLLLAAEGRQAQRERRAGAVSAQATREPEASASGPARRRSPGTVRIAVIGLLAAVALPSLLPGPGRGLLIPQRGDDATDLGAGGDGRARVVQPFVTLDQQLRSEEIVPLMRVRTDTPEYLRLTALELFDGTRFSLGRLQADPQARVSNGLPGTPEVRSSPASAEVRVEDVYRQRYLPVPYAPTAISIDGDWRLFGPTRTVFSGRTDTGGTTYQYSSLVPTPTANELRDEPAPVSLPTEVGVNRRLSGVNRDVLELARQLTADQPTTYDKVAAIQQYLRSPLFTYDLDGAPRNDRDALRTFLLETRRGYCEQFASAMAVMVRAIGVPARVAIGFTPGTRDAEGDWVVTNRDAHAWPEVWFPNAGWVRFEPTPRDDSTEVPPDYSIPPPPGTTGLEEETGSTSIEEGPVRGDLPAPTGALPAPEAGPSEAPDDTGGGPALSGALVSGSAAVLLVGALVVPAACRALRRRRRLGSGPDAAVWREVADTATDLGLGAGPAESPRAVARRWQEHVGSTDSDADGATRKALAALAAAEERSRYGIAPDGSGRGEAGLREAGRTAVAGLERASGRRDRLRAALLPRTFLQALRGRTDAARTRLPRPAVAMQRLRRMRRVRDGAA